MSSDLVIAGLSLSLENYKKFVDIVKKHHFVFHLVVKFKARDEEYQNKFNQDPCTEQTTHWKL